MYAAKNINLEYKNITIAYLHAEDSIIFMAVTTFNFAYAYLLLMELSGEALQARKAGLKD